MIEEFKVQRGKFDEVYHKIKLIFTHVFMACEKKLARRSGTFELLGCDILFDEKLTPYLLEMNSNPAIFTGLF
jgi:D-alanine-D-alanine ligase-like ATP-grasp enzyme